MNDEHKIKTLFAELRRDEESRAPEFAAVWSAANSRLQRQHRQRYFLRISAVAAGLMALGLVAALLPELEPKQPRRTVPVAGLASASAPLPQPGLPWRTALLVSQWRAPTDFLLEPSEGSSTVLQFNSPKPNPYE